MSPNLLQGKRVRRCPTEEETGDKTRSLTLLGENKSGDVPVENHCEIVSRDRDEDCHSQQSTLLSTGKVQSEATRKSFDL